MNTVDPIPTEKLLLTYRVEPSCLGPDGISRIKDFCNNLTTAFVYYHNNYLIYQFIPVYDKTLAAMKLSINYEYLSEAKSSLYMGFFTQTLESFGEDLQDQFTFFDRQFFWQTDANRPVLINMSEILINLHIRLKIRPSCSEIYNH
jgi:hypothetical protein